MTADHLGSTRVVTNPNKAIVMCRDYLPFGDELIASSQNGRNGISCYGEDETTHRFTGKERDSESRLDNFIARYYSWAAGRFNSPDEFTGGAVDPFTGKQISDPGPLPYADIGLPQSLNKYTYVLNNPLRYTDPDGHCVGPLAFWCVAAGVAAVEWTAFKAAETYYDIKAWWINSQSLGLQKLELTDSIRSGDPNVEVKKESMQKAQEKVLTDAPNVGQQVVDVLIKGGSQGSTNDAAKTVERIAGAATQEGAKAIKLAVDMQKEMEKPQQSPIPPPQPLPRCEKPTCEDQP